MSGEMDKIEQLEHNLMLARSDAEEFEEAWNRAKAENEELRGKIEQLESLLVSCRDDLSRWVKALVW